MATFLLRRLILAIFVVLAVATLTFFAMRLNGSNPIAESMSASGASQQAIASAERALGYDRPLVVQYGAFLSQFLHGNLGTSVSYEQADISLIAERAPFTLELAGAALAITLVVGIPIGIISAIRRGSFADHLSLLFAGLGQSVPSFVAGPILILLFAVWLRWLPVAGAASVSAVVLPAVTLALYPAARVARLLRASMLDVLKADYVTTARAKGLAERLVVVSHIFRNALLPVLTIVGLQIIGLLGGAVVVESVFGWPGIGSLAVSALLNSDFPLVQAIVIVSAVAVVVVNLLTDLLYALADPRIKVR